MDAPEHEEAETQQWACGPFGFWPVPGSAPAGVSWSYVPERETQAAAR